MIVSGFVVNESKFERNRQNEAEGIKSNAATNRTSNQSLFETIVFEVHISRSSQIWILCHE